MNAKMFSITFLMASCWIQGLIGAIYVPIGAEEFEQLKEEKLKKNTAILYFDSTEIENGQVNTYMKDIDIIYNLNVLRLFVNHEDNQTILPQYQTPEFPLTTLPAFIFFKNGAEIKRIIGFNTDQINSCITGFFGAIYQPIGKEEFDRFKESNLKKNNAILYFVSNKVENVIEVNNYIRNIVIIYSLNVLRLYVDFEENKTILPEYQTTEFPLTTLPSFIYYQNGAEIKRIIGFDKDEINSCLEGLIGNIHETFSAQHFETLQEEFQIAETTIIYFLETYNRQNFDETNNSMKNINQLYPAVYITRVITNNQDNEEILSQYNNSKNAKDKFPLIICIKYGEIKNRIIGFDKDKIISCITGDAFGNDQRKPEFYQAMTSLQNNLGFIGAVHDVTGFKELEKYFKIVQTTILYFIKSNTKKVDEINAFMNETSNLKKIFILKINTAFNDNEKILSQYETPELELTIPSFVCIQRGKIIKRIIGFDKNEINTCITRSNAKFMKPANVKEYNELIQNEENLKMTILYFVEVDTVEARDINSLLSRVNKEIELSVDVIEVTTTFNDNIEILAQYKSPVFPMKIPSFICVKGSLILNRFDGFDRDKIIDCIRGTIAKYHNTTGVQDFVSVKKQIGREKRTILYFTYRNSNDCDKLHNIYMYKIKTSRYLYIVRVHIDADSDINDNSDILTQYGYSKDSNFPLIICYAYGMEIKRIIGFNEDEINSCLEVKVKVASTGEYHDTNGEKDFESVKKQIGRGKRTILFFTESFSEDSLKLINYLIGITKSQNLYAVRVDKNNRLNSGILSQYVYSEELPLLICYTDATEIKRIIGFKKDEINSCLEFEEKTGARLERVIPHPKDNAPKTIPKNDQRQGYYRDDITQSRGDDNDQGKLELYHAMKSQNNLGSAGLRELNQVALGAYHFSKLVEHYILHENTTILYFIESTTKDFEDVLIYMKRISNDNKVYVVRIMTDCEDNLDILSLYNMSEDAKNNFPSIICIKRGEEKNRFDGLDDEKIKSCLKDDEDVKGSNHVHQNEVVKSNLGLIGAFHESSGFRDFLRLKQYSIYVYVETAIFYFIEPDTNEADEMNAFMNEKSNQEDIFILKINTTLNYNKCILFQYSTPKLKLTIPSCVCMKRGTIIKRIPVFDKDEINSCITGSIGKVRVSSGVKAFQEFKKNFIYVKTTILYFIEPKTNKADEINGFMNEISSLEEIYIVKINTTLNDNREILNQYETSKKKQTIPSFVCIKRGKIIKRINVFDKDEINKCITGNYVDADVDDDDDHVHDDYDRFLREIMIK